MSYDLIVIGGGSAGHSAAKTAASLGLHCALIEEPGPLGGLCILKGCMPSKALIETANRMREIRDSKRFGIITQPPILDLPSLHQRADVLLSDFRNDRRDEMQNAGYALIRGTATLASPHEIILSESGEKLHAKAFIIATGSRVSLPPIEGLEGTPYWVSDDMIELPFLPKSIAILGHGAIGMEAAHLFEGLGSQVTVLARGNQILTSFDADVSEALKSESIHRGIDFLMNTKLNSVKFQNDQFHLNLSNGEALQVDAFLIATGRDPNTIGFGFQKIGIAMEHKRILIDARCSTSIRNIFAAGDCASPIPVVHLAVIQGEVAAKNVEHYLRNGHSALPYEWNPKTGMIGLFTEPPCVEIGITQKKAKELGLAVVVGKTHYNDQGKGMISGSRHGFVKVVADAASHQIIGAVAIGPEVIETSQTMVEAISLELTLEEYLKIPHYHPTLVEAWSSAAEAALTG